MGLRKINREREAKKGFSLPGIGKKKHFAKLNTSRDGSSLGESSENSRLQSQLFHRKGPSISKPSFSKGSTISSSKIPKDKLIPIVIIVIIAISIIGLEVYFWGQKGTLPKQVSDSDTTNTTSNNTELVINKTKTLQTDIDVRSVDLSKTSVDVGSSVDITANIKNSGDTNISNLTVAFFIEKIEIGRKKVASLPVDESTQVTLTWNATEMFVGEYRAIIVADPDDIIDEGIETNNQDDKLLVIKAKIVEDVSSDFYQRSKIGFVSAWYSDKFQVPPKSGEDYKYFEITKSSTDLYYLDIVVAGFKTTKQGEVYKVEVPDASASGWNSDSCLSKDSSATSCIWNGPLYALSIDFEKSKIVVKDTNGAESTSSATDNEVDSIKLVGMRTAVWPEKGFKTYRAYGAAQPDQLIPDDFAEIVGDGVRIYPMRWNPRSLNAEVVTWLRFEVKTD